MNQYTTTSKVNYIPIGESNFESIVRNGQFYIDKTHCIPSVEKQLLLSDKITEFNGVLIGRPHELVLARPNGWGKSTFLSMIQCYYDIKKKDEFNDLFGHLHIGNNYTINRNSYYVMKFDFSKAKSNFTTIEEFNHEINSIIKKSLIQFIDYYQLRSVLYYLDTHSEYYSNFYPDASMKNKETIVNIQLLNHICNYLKLNKYNKLLILVDEVDKQVNDLILENQQLYASFIKCSPVYGNRAFNKIFDPLEEFLGSFYLLNNMSFEIHHVFVNTTPISFSHGYINSNTNWDDEFEDCMGFTTKELKQNALNNFELNNEIIEKLIANYGNYHFRGSTPLLNPSLVLREFNGGEESIQQQLRINSNKYGKLLDHIENLNAPNELRFNDVICFQQFINFNRLVEYDGCWTKDYLISYLIYQGILSIKSKQFREVEFSIPNLFAIQSLSELHYHNLLLIIEKLHKLQLRLRPSLR